jgi:hypothetical protein
VQCALTSLPSDPNMKVNLSAITPGRDVSDGGLV